MEEDSLFLRRGNVFLRSGAFNSLLLDLNEVEDFALEAKLVAIKTEVKVAILDFFFFEWASLKSDAKLREDPDEEPEEPSEYESTAEDISFELYEEVTKILGLKLHGDLTSFS